MFTSYLTYNSITNMSCSLTLYQICSCLLSEPVEGRESVTHMLVSYHLAEWLEHGVQNISKGMNKFMKDASIKFPLLIILTLCVDVVKGHQVSSPSLPPIHPISKTTWTLATRKSFPSKTHFYHLLTVWPWELRSLSLNPSSATQINMYKG